MAKSASAPSAASVEYEFLAKYQQAWSDHDADAIVAMMTPDCIYEASYGPEAWGQRFTGREIVREGILRLRAASEHPDTLLEHYETHIFGNRGIAMWTSTYTEPDGKAVSVHGFDYYEFKDGLVSKKIAYRKSN